MTVKTIIPQHAQDALAHARQARLRALDPEQMAQALTFLAGYSPTVFDATWTPPNPSPTTSQTPPTTWSRSASSAAPP